MSDEKLNVIGQPLRKVDAAAKVTGRTIFADDVILPQMIYAKILRSTRPYARIVSINAADVETMDGVKAILLGADHLRHPAGFSGRTYPGHRHGSIRR